MKTHQIKEKFKIDDKRFYIPFKLKANCPICNNEIEFIYICLSFPVLNDIETIWSYCEKCDAELETDIILKMSIEYNGKIRKQ